jgi:hypothetical protein
MRSVSRFLFNSDEGLSRTDLRRGVEYGLALVAGALGFAGVFSAYALGSLYEWCGGYLPDDRNDFSLVPYGWTCKSGLDERSWFVGIACIASVMVIGAILARGKVKRGTTLFSYFVGPFVLLGLAFVVTLLFSVLRSLLT